MNQLAASISLERAVTFLLLSDQEKLLQLTPSLDALMFLEPGNYGFIAEAADLVRQGIYSRLNLLKSMDKRKDAPSNPALHWNLLASVVTSNSRFEAHYPMWLDEARRRYVTRAEQELGPDRGFGELLDARRKVIARAATLGGVETGFDMGSAAQLLRQEYAEALKNKGRNIITTGFTNVDDATTGLLPSTVTVVAGRPGVGKTALACQWAHRAQQWGTVLFNSLEMPVGRLTMRLACLEKGLNMFHFLRPWLLSQARLQVCDEAIAAVAKLNLRITSIADVASLEAAVSVIKPVLVIHDFLQILPTPSHYRNNRPEFLGQQAQEFALVAKRTGVPVIILSQKNRYGQELESLKGSGGIEEAADTVFLLDRPQHAEGGPDSLRVTIQIAKARYGVPFVEDELLFDGRLQRFSPWDEVQAQHIASELGI